MSDETKKTATTATEPINSGGATETPKTFTQEDIDKILSDRLARERGKYQDYDDVKKKAETLEAELKQRKEADMTELEKAKAAGEEAKKQVEALNTYKERWEGYEKRQAERVTKELEGLTDQQKAIVEKLANPDDQLEAISQFKATQPGRIDVAGGAGARTTNKPVSQLNKEELAAEFEKYKKGAS